MRTAPICIAVALAAVTAFAQNGFHGYGVGAPIAENGGVVTARDGNGKHIVIANSMDLSPRGWLLVTDIDTGETQQIYFPEGVGNGNPYASMLAKSGKFYTAEGREFLEFDPTSRQFTFHGVPSPEQGVYMWMTEDNSGTVWAGGTPATVLWSFDPKTREFKDHGRMDPEEKYLSELAVDDAGWVYGGIGTAKCNIVAYNPASGEKRQIVPEDKRTTGTASVYLGVDGKVYGQAKLSDGVCRYRMFEGQAELIEAADMAAKAPTGSIYNGAKRGQFPDGRRLTYYNMPRRWMDIEDPKAGQTRRIPFDYESEGLQVTSFGEGPGGTVYASTAHPMHLLKLDTNTGKLEDMGPIGKVGGGNFCSIATQGGKVFGVAYDNGCLWEYDPERPWTWSQDPSGEEFCDTPAEQLVRAAEMQDGRVWFQGSQNVALVEARKSGAVAHFKLNAPQDAEYYLHIFPYLCSYYCTGHFLFDGEEIGEPYDGKAYNSNPGPMRVYGPLKLKAGEHRFSVRTEFDKFEDRFFGLCGLVLTAERHDEAYLANIRNPRVVAQWRPDISRPRAALAHPDGKHVLMAGHAGYGLVGGGLGIYDMETKEAVLLKDEEHMPGHATIALSVLPNGDVVGGTSVDARGGGHSVATDGEVYIMDWKTKQVSFHTVPAPGDGNIISVRVGPDGLIYGISKGAVFFVLDPDKKGIVHSESFEEYGSPVRHALQLGPDGNLYAILTHSVVRIAPGTFEHEKLADSPVQISAGGALVNGMLVFAGGSRVWSYEVPGL